MTRHSDADTLPDPSSRSDDEAPSPAEFAEQLGRQLLADLDGVFADGEGGGNARSLLIQAVGDGQARGAALWVLLRAALAAHAALLEENHQPDAFIEPDADAVLAALARWVPTVLENRAYWSLAGPALSARQSLAEGRPESTHQATARAIHRLYHGLRSHDERASHAGLLELRAMVVHLDACAQLGDGEAALVPVLRPDRFHDDFLRYASAAQAGSADLEQPVAALGQDGRLTAVVIGSLHPVEHARRALRDGNTDGQLEVTLQRIEALLDQLAALRAENHPWSRAAISDEAAFIGLVTAAATTPMRDGKGFERAPLLQVARFNQQLMRSTMAGPGQAH